jgi:hypothetical protein
MSMDLLFLTTVETFVALSDALIASSRDDVWAMDQIP